MISDNTRPTTLHDQLLILSKQVGAVRDALNSEQIALPKEKADDLNNLETVLSELSTKMQGFETEHSNLLELAGIV